MITKKNIPLGILFFIIFIVIFDLIYLAYLSFYLMLMEGYLDKFLSLTPVSLIMGIDILLTILALFIIPYGFTKRRNWSRLYAILFLTWSAVGSLAYIITTGDIPLRYCLFAVYVLLIAYLFLSPVQNYFGNIYETKAPVITTFTYGEYTLYSKLVRLKNGKLQLIYFFSKKIPKSGHPASFPDGYRLEVSPRSGLPYLKKL